MRDKVGKAKAEVDRRQMTSFPQVRVLGPGKRALLLRPCCDYGRLTRRLRERWGKVPRRRPRRLSSSPLLSRHFFAATILWTCSSGSCLSPQCMRLPS